MLVMIDNYDSFTHNLVRYFQELGQHVKVFRHDAITVQQLRQLAPQGILISPGPGTPDQAGVSLAVIEAFAGEIPILGICLGHQAIAQVFGAQIVRAPQVMHGKRSRISHTGCNLFQRLPNPYFVTRYHSLVVSEASLPPDLCIEARVGLLESGGEIMALSHRHWPIFGVQFHPESIVTEHGHAVLENFCRLAGLEVNPVMPDLNGA